MKVCNNNIFIQLSPQSQKSYISLCRKSENIKNKLIIIEDIKQNIIKGLPQINENDKVNLLNNIYEFCEYMYACMEYTGQIIRDVCRSNIRGEELKDGFNSILKDVIKFKNGNKQSKIFSNIVLKNYILQTQEWYDIIHSIRTEETHYGNGDIQISDTKADSIVYCNTLRNGKGNLKDLTIDIEYFSQISTLFNMFLIQLDTIIETVLKMNKI